MNDITSIKPNHLYVVSELAEQVGIGKKALREARRNGLPIRYWGNRSYIMGKDMIAHIMANGRAER